MRCPVMPPAQREQENEPGQRGLGTREGGQRPVPAPVRCQASVKDPGVDAETTTSAAAVPPSSRRTPVTPWPEVSTAVISQP